MSEKNANGKSADKADSKGDLVLAKDAVSTDHSEKGPPEGLRALAMDYPIALIGGGVVAGLLIGSLLPRGTPGRLSRGAAALAGIAGEWGVDYARKALSTMGEAAHDATETGAKAASVVGEKAGDLAHQAGEAIGTYSGKAADTAETALVSLRSSAEGLARQVIRLTSQLRH